jgi:hypothetical protein
LKVVQVSHVMLSCLCVDKERDDSLPSKVRTREVKPPKAESSAVELQLRSQQAHAPSSRKHTLFLSRCHDHDDTTTQTPPTMINAVLVFNNNGQPRLTKFYTQLVRNRH